MLSQTTKRIEAGFYVSSVSFVEQNHFSAVADFPAWRPPTARAVSFIDVSAIPE
jgi:hypothetical protein